MQDRIEQEITIKASLDRVWELVSRPGWWVPSQEEFPADRTPGSATVRSSEKWGQFPVEVVKLEPKTYAAFRWASAFPGEGLTAGNATLVEFFVQPKGEQIAVTVVESGFTALDLPEGKREGAWKDNNDGWREVMADLTREAQAA